MITVNKDTVQVRKAKNKDGSFQVQGRVRFSLDDKDYEYIVAVRGKVPPEKIEEVIQATRRVCLENLVVSIQNIWFQEGENKVDINVPPMKVREIGMSPEGTILYTRIHPYIVKLSGDGVTTTRNPEYYEDESDVSKDIIKP